MGILGRYLKCIKNIGDNWDIETEKSEQRVTTILLIPSILVFVSIAISIIFGLYAGKVSIELFFFELPVLIITLVSFYLFSIKKFRESRLLLVCVIGLVSIFCFYNWGVLHYLGVLFGIFFISVSFFTFPMGYTTILLVGYLFAVLILGLLQSLNLVLYNYTWSPQVFIFDFIVILFTFILLTHVVWIYRVSAENKIKKILELNYTIEEANEDLQRKVLEKTFKLMKSRSEIDKSHEILTDAYKQLNASEQDRFVRMNRLAHYAISVSRKVHDIKAPLMYIMNVIDGMEMKSSIKNDLETNLRSVIDDFETIQDSVREPNDVKRIEVNSTIRKCLKVLDWKFKKYSILTPKVSTSKVYINGDAHKFSHVILNLLDNAISAVVSVNNPTISVAVSKGDYCVSIHINDNGMGVEKGRKKLLFRSFFTTKETGCGLGLYIAKMYIKEIWNGRIEYRRLKGITSFVIELPIYEDKRS